MADDQTSSTSQQSAGDLSSAPGFPVPKPPPPPLQGKVEIGGIVEDARPADGALSLPPSLLLPSEEEVKLEQQRQDLLSKEQQAGKAGAVALSVAQVALPGPTPSVSKPAGPGADMRPPTAAAVKPPAFNVQSPAPAPVPTPPVPPAAAPAVVSQPASPSPVPAQPAAAPTSPPVAVPVTPPPPVLPSSNPLGQQIVRRPSPPAPSLSQVMPSPAPVTPPAPPLPATPMPAPAPTPVFPPAQYQTPPQPPVATPASVAGQTPPLDANMNMLEGVNGEEAPSRRKPLFLILGAVGGLLAVLVVVFMLQRSGAIYLGFLRGLAGGFPKDPAQALALLKNSQPSAYAFNSKVSLVKSGSLPAVGGVEGEQTAAEASGVMEGKYRGGDWRTSFNVQLANDYPITTLQGKAVRRDDRLYTFIDTLSLLQSDNAWREINSNEWVNTVVSLPFEALELAAVLGQARDGQFLGRNNLSIGSRSYDVAVYQFVADAFYDYRDAEFKEGRLLVWVERNSGVVVEYQLDQLLSNEAQGDFVFQSVWEIDPLVEVGEIALDEGVSPRTGTVLDLAAGLGFITVDSGPVDLTTPEGRDKKRTSDLLALKEALLEYKNQKGTFPVATTVDKTRESRILKSALVPDYIMELPVDPNDPKAYYGYTSDGFSFKLTSLLESSSTPGAKKADGFYYQEIHN